MNLMLGKTTLFSIVLIVILIGFISACKSPDPKLAQPGFVRLLQDTTGNNRAKMDLLQLEYYNNICKAVGLNSLYDGCGGAAGYAGNRAQR